MPATARTSWGAALLALVVGAGAAPATAQEQQVGTAADESVVVLATDFEDGTTGPWERTGEPALEVVDGAGEDGGRALLVAGRTADFDGIKSPAGLLEPGATYTFEMSVRLAAGTPGSAGVRFVVEPSYTWVGATTMTAEAWTTVTGTWTVPTDADPATQRVYLGTGDLPDLAGYDYLVDDVRITAPAGTGGDPEDPQAPGEVVLATSFEDGLDGWVPRGDGDGDPTVTSSDLAARTGERAALVSGRTSQGDGLGRDVTDVLRAGTTYEVTAWVRFAPGEPTDDVWLSMQRESGGTTSFDTIAQLAGVTSTGWTELRATYQVPTADSLFLYVETRYPDGSSGDLLVDDVTVRAQARPVVQDLPPLQGTVPFPLGVAIDERETTGAAAELLTRHFGQVSAENHMKPEAWYAGDGPDTFRTHPQATAIMRFAQQEDLDVYGHVLVWHSQTPAWFFQRADGTPLTTSEADKQLLRERMRTHVFAVAETLAAEYGPFGSDTNPLVSWDVVNEVISDSGEFDDGMRRSEWYRVLGEEFVDLAFRYADEAFNDVHAAPGTERPVRLYINDYNTEQAGKQGRYRALVERLLARDVPVDGVGHQFHVSLSVPVGALDTAIERFSDLPLTQVVTELDVTTGTPETEARFVDQGYYYRDAFRVFRERADVLDAVTVWGLTDGRSWRAASGGPLLFDDGLQAKPAYFGAADAELPPRQRTAVAFRGGAADGAAGLLDPVWDRLPLLPVERTAGFQLRWEPSALTVLVAVDDTTAAAGDEVAVRVGDDEYRVGRDGGAVDGATAHVSETDGGWRVLARLPLADAAQGDLLPVDVEVVDAAPGGTTTVAWNEPGVLGTVTLVEPLSHAVAVETGTAPVLDGEVDEVWSLAEPFATGTQVEGDGGASAQVRALWEGQTLHVLAEVSDPVLDAGASDPWQQDSVELFLDAGNIRNGPYRYDDMQVRISHTGSVSFGTGDEGFQAARVERAVRVVDGGYVVEASLSLLEYGGAGTFHGFDVQVNDASAGARTGVRTWADPTGLGYQTTTRWGVLELVGADEEEPPAPPAPPSLDLQRLVTVGGDLPARLSGATPGERAELVLRVQRGPRSVDLPLRRATVAPDGTADLSARVPEGAPHGRHAVVVLGPGGAVLAEADVVVRPAAAGPRSASR